MSRAVNSSGSGGVSTRAATQLHVLHAFDSMLDSLGHQAQPPVKHKWNGDKFPLFVTWKKRHSGSEWRLRGCIGTFSPKELAAGLREYAVIAAFHDTRFSPIVASELAHLRCDISLLTQFEIVTGATTSGSSAAAAAAAAASSSSSAPDPLHDWSIGTHGIQIDFHCPSTARKFNATFLPEVALEQGWSHAETLSELIAKAGFRGNVDAALRKGIKLTRYQSEKESLTFAQYCALREQLTGVPHALALKSGKPDADGPHALKHKPTAAARATHHINDPSDDDEDVDEPDEFAEDGSDVDDDALSAAAEARAAAVADLKAQAHQAKKSKTATANGTGARK